VGIQNGNNNSKAVHALNRDTISRSTPLALIEFQNPTNNVRKQRRTSAPTKATLKAWFKLCRKLIPEIPDAPNGDWNITHEEADLKWIKFELQNISGQRCYVVIDRTAPAV
jgi:hypothetical protein